MSTSAGRVLILPKNEYSSETTYNMLDLVRYNNAAYVCKKTTTGNAPTDNGDNEWWMLLVIGSSVQGVKGDAEADYRDGNVNLTPANLGIYHFAASTLTIGGTVPPSEIAERSNYLRGDGNWDDTPIKNIGNLNSLDTTAKTSAVAAINEVNGKTSTLYLTSVACSATTGNFANVSNAAITADHVVVECVFNNPSAITTDVTWTTSSGSLVLNGTCTSATTATITLIKKNN